MMSLFNESSTLLRDKTVDLRRCRRVGDMKCEPGISYLVIYDTEIFHSWLSIKSLIDDSK